MQPKLIRREVDMPNAALGRHLFGDIQSANARGAHRWISSVLNSSLGHLKVYHRRSNKALKIRPLLMGGKGLYFKCWRAFCYMLNSQS